MYGNLTAKRGNELAFNFDYILVLTKGCTLFFACKSLATTQLVHKYGIDYSQKDILGRDVVLDTIYYTMGDEYKLRIQFYLSNIPLELHNKFSLKWVQACRARALTSKK